jgi:hypothetical protein
MKKKRRSDTAEAAGQDSFLDIVSNIVGILIILVVVAGLRIKQMPAESDDPAKIEAAVQKYQEKTAVFQQTHLECLNLSSQLEVMQKQSSLRQAEQADMIHYAANLEAEIRLYQETLDKDSQNSFQLRRELSETDAKLAQLAQNVEWLKQNRPQAVKLENHPTPKTQTVREQEKEVHFRLLEGKIVHVPFSLLFEKLKLEVVRRQSELLMNQSRITGLIGPVENFRMKFSVLRRDLPPQLAYSTGQRSMIELERCEFVPVGSDVGETLSEALRGDSAFSRRLLVSRQNECTITLWVYPDSFAEYQQVKEFLFKRGYLTAARPLNFGVPIAASPDGSHTSRQ